LGAAPEDEETGNKKLTLTVAKVKGKPDPSPFKAMVGNAYHSPYY